MRKKIAMLTAAAMAASATGAVYADGEGFDSVVALNQEMSQLDNAKIVETMKMIEDGEEITYSVEADLYEGAIGNVNIQMDMNIEGESFSISLEDLFRYIPEDAAYLNVGALLDMMSELSGEDMNAMVGMYGLTEDWIAVYTADLPVIPAEQTTALADMLTAYITDCMNALESDVVSAIDGGYQVTLTGADTVAFAQNLIGGFEEQSETLVPALTELIANIDVQPFIDSYVVSVVDALADADPSFDRDAVMEQINMIPALLPALADPELFSDFEELDSDELTEELAEMEEIPVSTTVTVTKTADGSYVTTSLMTVEDDEYPVSSEVEAVVTPGAANAVSAPESSQDLKILLGTIIRDNYDTFSLIMESMFAEDDDWDDDDWDDDDFSEEPLVIDGNRIQVTDYDNSLTAWVTYDEAKLEFDPDFSASYSLNFNINDTYEYIILNASPMDFASTYQEETSYYLDPEFFTDGVVGELTTLEGSNIQYGVTTYKSDEYDYTTMYFGINVGDGCVYGSYDFDEYTMKMEDYLAVLAEGLVSIDLAE